MKNGSEYSAYILHNSSLLINYFTSTDSTIISRTISKRSDLMCIFHFNGPGISSFVPVLGCRRTFGFRDVKL